LRHYLLHNSMSNNKYSVTIESCFLEKSTIVGVKQKQEWSPKMCPPLGPQDQGWETLPQGAAWPLKRQGCVQLVKRLAMFCDSVLNDIVFLQLRYVCSMGMKGCRPEGLLKNLGLLKTSCWSGAHYTRSPNQQQRVAILLNVLFTSTFATFLSFGKAAGVVGQRYFSRDI
jgi:hypothetical protein